MSKYCLICQRAVEKGNFCWYCGSKLSCVTKCICGNTLNSEHGFCIKCGKKREEEFKG